MSDTIVTALIGAVAMVIVELIRRGPAKQLLTVMQRVERRQLMLARHLGVDFDDERNRVITLRKPAAVAEYQSEAAKP